MDRARLLTLLFVAAGALPGPAHAQEAPALTSEELAWLGAHGPIRFVGNDGFAPFILYGNRSVPQGINRDFAQLMGVHLGIEFEFVQASNFSNTLESLRNGSADLAGNLNMTPERQAFLSFTEPYAEARTVFWGRTGYQLPAELAGVRVAVVKNTASFSLVSERYPLAVLHPVDDLRLGLRDVEAGRADVLLGSDAPSAFLAREEELFGLSPVGPPFDSRQFHFAVPKDETVLLGILSKGLTSIPPDQRAAIFVKWTGFDLSPGARDVQAAPPMVPLWVQAAAGTIGGAAVLLAAWSVALRRQVASRTAALRESEERFERALAGSADGIWDLDLAAGTVTTSPRTNEIIGLRGDARLTQPEWQERIHPDDLERALKDLADHLQGTTPGFDTQYRVRHEDGDYRWVRVRGAAVRGSGTPPTRIAGTMTDITERYVAAQALQRSQARFQALTSAAQDAILFSDVDGRLSYVNPAAERMFGIATEDAVGRTLASLVPERHRAALAGWLTATSARGAPLAGHAVEIAGLRADGTEFPLEISLASWEENERTQFGAILRDVTERKQHEDALEVAKQQAEQASRAKSRFLANMSHEIRTPMNAVIGLSHLLERTDLTPEQREFVATIRSSGDHLLALINDVLDLSRIEADKVQLDERPFDPRGCVLASVDLVRPKAREKGLDVSVVVSPDIPPTLVADEGRLRQVLVNLLSNAVKFTKQGAVRLEADTVPSASGGRSLRLRVIDSGIGMSPEQVAGLFEPFQQGDASITRAYGGSGLGLSITKRLIDLMGGHIRVESQLAKGSTFEVTVPIVTRDVATPEAPAPLRPAPRERTPLRILVAEDIPVNQRIAGRLLEGMGHQVEFAGNGQEAVQMAAAGTYDAILMDVQMPVMDGLEATICIRTAIAPEQQPRIIGLTAHALDDERRRAIGMGMDDYLTKPIRPDELDAALQRVPPLTMATALDARRLDELRAQIGGDEELLDRILVEALGTAGQSSREIADALAAGDTVSLSRAAHKLKGAARLIGAREADLATTRLEELARSAQPGDAALAAAVQATQRSIERLRDALHARLAPPRTPQDPQMES